MKVKLFLISFSLIILSCHSNDNLKGNYLKAIKNQSTVQNFVVIKVKNLNNNELKEVCTTRNFLLGAIHSELNKKYDSIGRKEVQLFAESKSNRYFEFKNPESLKNISFLNYSEAFKNDLKITSNVKLIKEKLKKKNTVSINLDDDEMISTAHLLFNDGYLSAENTCFGGSLICYQKEN